MAPLVLCHKKGNTDLTPRFREGPSEKKKSDRIHASRGKKEKKKKREKKFSLAMVGEDIAAGLNEKKKLPPRGEKKGKRGFDSPSKKKTPIAPHSRNKGANVVPGGGEKKKKKGKGPLPSSQEKRRKKEKFPAGPKRRTRAVSPWGKKEKKGQAARLMINDLGQGGRGGECSPSSVSQKKDSQACPRKEKKEKAPPGPSGGSQTKERGPEEEHRPQRWSRKREEDRPASS